MHGVVINSDSQQLKFSKTLNNQNQFWQGPLDSISFDEDGIKAKLLNLNKPCYIIRIEKNRCN